MVWLTLTDLTAFLLLADMACVVGLCVVVFAGAVLVSDLLLLRRDDNALERRTRAR